ncbi:MAG: hypothetical protein JWL77_6304 [Chthonomonadaceae bacterium]|nr:hypothetical protein [Chthonomonadaceae bacterium]
MINHFAALRVGWIAAVLIGILPCALAVGQDKSPRLQDGQVTVGHYDTKSEVARAIATKLIALVKIAKWQDVKNLYFDSHGRTEFVNYCKRNRSHFARFKVIDSSHQSDDPKFGRGYWIQLKEPGVNGLTPDLIIDTEKHKILDIMTNDD